MKYIGLVIRNVDFSSNAIAENEVAMDFGAMQDAFWNSSTCKLVQSTGWVCCYKLMPKLGSEIRIYDENGNPNTKSIRFRSYASVDEGSMVDNMIVTDRSTLSASANFFALQTVYDKDSTTTPSSSIEGLDEVAVADFDQYTVEAIDATKVNALINPKCYVYGMINNSSYASADGLIYLGKFISTASIRSRFLLSYPILNTSDINGVTITPKSGYRIKVGYINIPSPAADGSDKVTSKTDWLTTPITIGSEGITQDDYIILSVANESAVDVSADNITDYIEITL